MKQILLLILTLASLALASQNQLKNGNKISASEQWADSVFSTLSPDERIAQLLMLRAYSNKDEKYYQELISTVQTLNLGGVCFFQGGPARQIQVTNRLQKATKTPLFVAIDAEWGLGMRLDSTINFPKQMTLGAVSDNSYIYGMGRQVAEQLKRIGVHINFAPVADINNNPLNPVINARSFGEKRELVAEKAFWYMKGMQDNGIIAVGKHFPGHGDTGNDSHYTLPVIEKSRASMDSLELYPFRYLVDRGIKGMMIAHLRVPSMDTAARSISSLSKPIITGVLRNEMGFTGMVITDGMDMKGLTDFADPKLAEVMAIDAGNDILLLPVDAFVAIKNVRAAIDSGLISQALIDEKCKRVLRWKHESGLNKFKEIPLNNLSRDLASHESEDIIYEANARAITLVSDPAGTIPVKGLDQLQIAALAIGDKKITPFQRRLADYAPVTFVNISRDPSRAERDSVMNILQSYNMVIAGFVQTSDLPQKNFGIGRQAAYFIDSLAGIKPTIAALFTSPYSLNSFFNTDKMAAVLVSYQDNAMMQDLTAQAIFGGIPVQGTLPVSAGKNYTAGWGIKRTDVIRLAFAPPALAGFDPDKLSRVDALVESGLRAGAFPGAQVLVVMDGKVALRKSYGYQDYTSGQTVRNSDIYDLASLTKILGTTLAAMKLTGDKLLDPDKKLSYYFPLLRNSNKNHLIIREIMAHQARLQPYIPFYKASMNGNELKDELYGAHYSTEYSHRVADGIYLRDDYHEKIIDSIIKSPLLPKTEYKYSDLGFILLAKAFEQITEQPFSSYLERNFYDKLGLRTMGFNPRDRFSLSRIAPTEMDTIFRKQLVHGDVHDPAAAMLGGVAGHAGLFSDALDVAVLMQMLLDDGRYGGETFLDADVINDFTSVQFSLDKNRRGAGFDKPALIPGQASPSCKNASSKSYGHSGFTGTYVWSDPENNLIYVFLSNRVNPDAGNNKITNMNLRTDIHQAIYEAILPVE